MPVPLIVMGVSGAGKSTVAGLLAERLGRRFLDADALHPPSNRAKMAAGTPLDDDDRWPWLDAVGAALRQEPGTVVACSALRRVYRDRLRLAVPEALCILLEVDRAELEHRLAARSHEFMPASLLDSQLALLEPIADDEAGLRIEVQQSPAELVERIVDRLAALPSADQLP